MSSSRMIETELGFPGLKLFPSLAFTFPVLYTYPRSRTLFPCVPSPSIIPTIFPLPTLLLSHFFLFFHSIRLLRFRRIFELIGVRSIAPRPSSRRIDTFDILTRIPSLIAFFRVYILLTEQRKQASDNKLQIIIFKSVLFAIR